MLKTIIVPEVNTNKWADLPADILTRILKHLDLNTDLTRLRGVCPSWRSALPLEEHYPSFRSHIQVPSLAHGIWCDRTLYLIETAFYFFSPINSSECGTNSSGWVARMGQIASKKWRLLNPLSSHDLYNVASYRNEFLLTDPPIVGEINLLDCRVFLLSKALTLVDEVNFNAKPISTKVVGEWDLTSSTRPLSAILVLVAPDPVSGFVSSRLLLLRPNDAQNQENEWAEISEWWPEENNQYNLDEHDIAYSNGVFFVYQVNGDRWRVRTVNPSDKTVVLKPFASGRIIQTLSSVSLVPSISNNCVYLVVKPEFGYIQCFYLILNEFLRASGDESKKKTINKFEDEFLFCSNYLSFSFQSTTLLNNSPLLQHKNSVMICNVISNNYCYSNHMPKGVECLNFVKYRYYRENFSICITKEENAYDRFVLQFDNDQKINGLFFDVMPRTERQDYKKMFFPPPAWVKWRCPSLDDVEVKLDDLPDYSSYDDDDYVC